jgi:glycerol-3-phosphate dehydrogenase
VIFLLPWEGRAMAGTTDTPCAPTASPIPTQEDVEFILREVSSCLRIQIRPSDVLSVW